MTKLLLSLSALCYVPLAHAIVASPPCTVTLNAGQDIQSALGSGGTPTNSRVVCLNAGTWNLNATISMPNYSELRGTYNSGWSTTINTTADKGIEISGRSGVVVRYISINGSTTSSTYDVSVYQSANVTIDSNLIRYSAQINIGLNGGTNYSVTNNTIAYQGYANSQASPSIWNNATSTVTIYGNTIYGMKNGPGGDGEMSNYNCSNLNISWNYEYNSGASCIYVVNCSGGSIQSNRLHNCGEWGLDLVQGTSNFKINDNQVWGSYYGTAVVSDVGTGKPQQNMSFVGNNFQQGNSSGYANCPCININTSTSPNFSQSSTTCLVNNKSYAPTCFYK